MKSATRTGTALAVAWGLVVAVAAYAVMRAVQPLASAPMNPAAIARSLHARFFWRMLTVGYAGGFAAFVPRSLARERAAAVARALAPAVASPRPCSPRKHPLALTRGRTIGRTAGRVSRAATRPSRADGRVSRAAARLS